MTLGQAVLLVYAVLMLVGGLIGYLTAKSKPSLIAGSASAALLVVAWVLARSSASGLWLGALVALALCGVFAARLRKTGKLMPSGMMLAVSAVALVLLAWTAATF